MVTNLYQSMVYPLIILKVKREKKKNHSIKTFHSYLWLLHAYNLPPFKVFHDFEGFFFLFVCMREKERGERERETEINSWNINGYM